MVKRSPNPPSLQSLDDLAEILYESNQIADLMTTHNGIAFSGVWGSIRGLLAAALGKTKPNLLMILPQAADADIVGVLADAQRSPRRVSMMP